MAFPTVATPANTNRISADIQSIYYRPSGELYQTLGAIQGGEITIAEYTEQDTRKKNKSIQSRGVTGKAMMMQCSLTEVELLDSLVAGTGSFLFKMADAAAIPTGGSAVTVGWWLFTSSQLGVKYKIDLSGDSDRKAFIQLEFAGSIQDSAVDAAIKAAIDDDEFEATGGSGTFKAIGVYTAAKDGGGPDVSHIKSCGIASLTLADTGGAAQTLGPIDEPTIEFEALAEQDSLKVFRAYSVAVNIQYHWKQTDSTNLLNLDDFSDSEIDVVVTMANGMVLTLTNKVGLGADLQSLGDFERTRSFVFKHQGQLLLTEVDGVFS